MNQVKLINIAWILEPEWKISISNLNRHLNYGYANTKLMPG